MALQMRNKYIIKKIYMKNETYENRGLASFSLYNIAFTVSSMDKSIKWYGDIFGFKLISRTTFSVPAGSAEAAIIERGGLRLELLEVPNAERIDALFAEVPLHLNVIGNKAIVLQVDDIAIATRELEEKGVTLVWREQYLVGDKMLCTMIQDVDGNKINIFQTDTLIGTEDSN
jgi:catechol 2,3-dioxygenase-like lactoylglutathione lyase family enzyme